MLIIPAKMIRQKSRGGYEYKDKHLLIYDFNLDDPTLFYDLLNIQFKLVNSQTAEVRQILRDLDYDKFCYLLERLREIQGTASHFWNYFSGDETSRQAFINEFKAKIYQKLGVQVEG